MRNFKGLLLLSGLSLALVLNGCSLFPENKLNPAPARTPKPTPTVSMIKITPMPTKTRKKTPMPTLKMMPKTTPKNTKMITLITEKDLLNRIVRIQNAVNTGNWTLGNQETKALGVEMNRFSPTGENVQDLLNIATFNTIYTKLQADMKIQNKKMVLNDLENLKKELRKTVLNTKKG